MILTPIEHKQKAYDMNEFKALLQKKASDIEPTKDIVMFGRKLYGAGLKEFDAVMSCSSYRIA